VSGEPNRVNARIEDFSAARGNTVEGRGHIVDVDPQQPPRASTGRAVLHPLAGQHRTPGTVKLGYQASISQPKAADELPATMSAPAPER
jgi:hypothetical protein